MKTIQIAAPAGLLIAAGLVPWLASAQQNTAHEDAIMGEGGSFRLILANHLFMRPLYYLNNFTNRANWDPSLVTAYDTFQFDPNQHQMLWQHGHASSSHELHIRRLRNGQVEDETIVVADATPVGSKAQAGATIDINGSAGWGVAEGMLSGEVIVRGSAGNSAAASIRGGTVVIHGDAGARAGVAMKGGLLIIEGNVAYMTGFMMQRGTIIACGNSGEALADSMYEGVIFIGGEIGSLGNDAVIEEPTADERAFVESSLKRYGIAGPSSFRKVVSGRRLWNFEKKELGVWKEAL